MAYVIYKTFPSVGKADSNSRHKAEALRQRGEHQKEERRQGGQNADQQ